MILPEGKMMSQPPCKSFSHRLVRPLFISHDAATQSCLLSKLHLFVSLEYWIKPTSQVSSFVQIKTSPSRAVPCDFARLYFRWGTIENNRPFAPSGHMVQNHTCWWPSCTVGLPKQCNSYQSTWTCLCFGSPTVQFGHQHVWFCTMWPGHAKGLFCFVPSPPWKEVCICHWKWRFTSV